MVSMFQLFLGRLWWACSSPPCSDNGRHVPTVPGQTMAGKFQLSWAESSVHFQVVSGPTMAGDVPSVPVQTMAGMFQMSLSDFCACSSCPWVDYGLHVPVFPRQTMVVMIQLSLDRLWRTCSRCPWADYEGHIPAVPGPTMAGIFHLSLDLQWGHDPAVS